jgi:hypothetical protein
MSGFILDTPEQINMWVLLSRRAQLKLQMKGIKTPGIVKWCRKNVPGAETARTARDCIVPLEYLIAENGGPQDFSIVNVHVMLHRGGVFLDRGIYSDMSEVEANSAFVEAYAKGRLEIVYTLDEPRDATGEMFVPA